MKKIVKAFLVFLLVLTLGLSTVNPVQANYCDNQNQDPLLPDVCTP